MDNKNLNGRRSDVLVLFRDGTRSLHTVYLWTGGCFVGDPTAYCFRNGQQIWLKPGESVEFIEA